MDKDQEIEAQIRIGEIYEDYKARSFQYANDLSAAELMQYGKHEIVLVDIREEKEQQVSMIPGAITKQKFELDIDKYLP